VLRNPKPMTNLPAAPPSGRPYLLPVLTAALALGVFAADTVTPPDVVVSGLYIVVVLMAGRFLTDRGLLWVAASCAGLTIVAQVLSHRLMHAHSPAVEAASLGTLLSALVITGAFNTMVSIVAIVLSTSLVLRGRAAERALREAQGDLARISRVTTMGELTASLAHEINQPIAAAVTNANACLRWLSGDAPNIEGARAAATRIVRDGTRAAEIITRIRGLFRKGAPERAPVDLNLLARETLALLRGEAARYAVSVRTELAADVAAVLGDRVQIQQVMVNLLVNGIDAMKTARGARELVLTTRRDEAGEIEVAVGDTGGGLPAHGADQIFEAFFTTKTDGTGMGLSISRSIIAAHGGRLWATPNTPHGAVFRFALPVQGQA
jgi:signal transduction histidine kinase